MKVISDMMFLIDDVTGIIHLTNYFKTLVA